MAGAQLIIHGRSREKLNKLKADLTEQGCSIETLTFDISKENEIRAALDMLHGRAVHAIVNNAYSGNSGSIKNASVEHYRESYEVGLISIHVIFNHLYPSLLKAVKEDGDASVVNIGSMYGVVSPDLRIYETEKQMNPPFYGAAKAALLQWTRYAACEFGCLGIRVNSITPGPFPSESVQLRDPSFIHRLSEKVPLGRIGHPDELVGPVIFLASRASSFVNGSNLAVDGGWTSW